MGEHQKRKFEDLIVGSWERQYVIKMTFAGIISKKIDQDLGRKVIEEIQLSLHDLRLLGRNTHDFLKFSLANEYITKNGKHHT